MKKQVTVQEVLFILIALALIKIAFSPKGIDNRGFVPSAHATGSILEWEGSSRIVTTGNDGATTYVWDYDAKTEVRKYFIKDGKLNVKTYRIGKE